MIISKLSIYLKCRIDLGDYYRTYLTLKSRKKNRTAFFTSVIEQLLKRMESDEL